MRGIENISPPPNYCLADAEHLSSYTNKGSNNLGEGPPMARPGLGLGLFPLNGSILTSGIVHYS